MMDSTNVGELTHLLFPDNVSSSLFPNGFEGGLLQSELARRFKVEASTIKRQWHDDQKKEPLPNPERFSKWSKKKDPDGLAWIKRDNKYFPIA